MPKFAGYFLVFALFLNVPAQAQKDSASSITFSGYADAYIAHYTDSVGTGNYQKFPTVSPRSNQIGLNVATLSAKYAADRVRATIALQYGDIPRSAWSTTFNFILEANAGIRLCKNLWLDGGFFRTHIGTEALLPKENYTSSVAVPTYFEPYYEAGLRLNYNPTDKLSLFLYLLNGYNLYEDNNKKKSAGLLATYVFSEKLNIGYDNYLGDDSPEGDSVSHSRFYNNAFVNFKLNKLRITTGADLGLQAHSQIDHENKPAVLFSGVFITSYQVLKQLDVYGRAEIFHDPNGFLSGVFADNKNMLTGLKIWGVTLGAEYKPTGNSYVRVEGRDLTASPNQEIFRWDHENKNNRLEVMLNFGVWFP